MVDGIKGGRDIKENQKGHFAPIGFLNSSSSRVTNAISVL